MRRPLAYLLFPLSLCLSATRGLAQGASLRGMVTDSATSEPLAAVRVEATGPGQVRATETDSRGRFSLGGLLPGTWTLRLRRVGYAPKPVEVRLEAGETGVEISLAAVGIPLDPIVVTASRMEQAALDAPTSISVVRREAVEERPAFTPLDHVQDVAGVDFARKGLTQSTFSYRGDRGASASSLLMLSDFRFAGIPSIGFNIPYLVAATNEDVERIEVQRGPAAALYGPGAPRGVLHIITRSPFESRGGVVSVTAGERSVFGVSARYAALLRPTLAYKVSADYFGGDDWPYVDPDENSRRAAAIAAGADPDTLRIGRRDPRVRRAGGEARLDWRPAAETEVVTAVGLAEAIRNVDLAPAVGSVQGEDWRYSFAQVRARRGRWFANAVYNRSDAGGTYLLRTGARLVDDSRMAVLQIQHGATVGRADLLYGADQRWTDPRTGGTIHGGNEADDLVSETGAYAHATVRMSERLDGVAALRADHHNRLRDLVVSPRVGVVYKPGPTHALRATYNRAFTSPDPNDLFLDIVAGRIPLPGGFGYDVRAVNVPRDGYHFRRDCGPADDQLCMRSPFSPIGYLPADVTVLWPVLVQFAQTQGFDLSDVPQPTSAQVGTVLASLNPATQQFDPVAASGVRDFAGPMRTITSTFEIGYKGNLAGRLGLGVDLWHNRLRNVQGRRVTGTPSVFFDGPSLQAYLSNYRSADSAALIATTVAQLPAGTVSPREAASSDILVLTPYGRGAYTLMGVDLSADYSFSRSFTVSGSYSWVSDDTIPEVEGAGTVFLNVPRTKGWLGVEYRSPGRGLAIGARARWVSGFSVSSGYYEGRVDSYGVVDANLAYSWRGWRRTQVVVSGQNLLGSRHREYVGAPELGRLVVSRLRVEF